jgi:CHASE2 domain-containing sensor protein
MKRLWFHSLMVTIFTAVFGYGLAFVLDLKAFSAFDPIGQAIGDMELSDISFHMRTDIPEDTNVAIVNIGGLTMTRVDIANQVLSVIRYKPKVIGFDVRFFNPKDTLVDLYFAAALQAARDSGVKVVLAEQLYQSAALRTSDTDDQDSIAHPIDVLREGNYEGFVNLDTDAEHQEDLKSCRRLYPKMNVNGKDELAYSVMMAWLADSVKTKKFLDRNNRTETINYRGNVIDIHKASDTTYHNKMFLLDPEQALDTTYIPEYERNIRGRVVLFGFLGEDMFDTSWDDKFFTPINKNYAGKTRPDMYGVVVHANVVSMILNEDYVYEMADWQEYLVAFIILILTTALFFKIEEKLPIWYDLLSLLIQVVLVVLFSVTMVVAFTYFSVKLNFTTTLAAAALVGTCFELYNGGILRLYHVLTDRFTKPKDEV